MNRSLACYSKHTGVLVLLIGAVWVVRAGAQTPAPHFALVSLDDSATLISQETLRGKTVLLDFWATWCPPCVEEIPELARVYEKFKGRNFEIVSLSFDKTAQHVQRFRAKHHPMPWLHAIVERGFGDYISEAFGVQNIPRQILLDPEGRIIAEDEELRGTRLEVTLSRHIPVASE